MLNSNISANTAVAILRVSVMDRKKGLVYTDVRKVEET
jgi:hypothetical protein